MKNSHGNYVQGVLCQVFNILLLSHLPIYLLIV